MPNLAIPQSVTKRADFWAFLSTDHATPATGKTIAITISKNGGAFGNPSAGATNATEIASGWYYVDLSTTDTNTTGPLVMRGAVSGVDDVGMVWEVVNAHNAGYDGIPNAAAGATGGIASNVIRGATATAGSSTTLTLDGSASAVDSYYNGAILQITSGANAGVLRTITGYVGSTKVATFAVALPATADSTPTFMIVALRHVIPGTDGKALISADTGQGAGLTALGDSRIANLDAAVSGRMATYTQPTGFLASTFPTTVASTTNISAGTITTVTNLTNAPTAGDLTATMKTSVTTAATAATPIAASVTGAVGSVTAGVTVTTNNDKTGYGLSAGAVQAIWDALTSALTTTGSIGKKLADWVIGTTQTGDSYARLGAPAGASVSADVAAVKADTGSISGRIPAALTGAGNIKADAQVVSDKTGYTASTVSDKTGYALTSTYDPAKTAAQAGDAMALTTGERTSTATAVWASATRTLSSFGTLVASIWDEALSGHLTAGTSGAALSSAGAGTDPWATAIPGSYGAGTAGKTLGDNINATISSRSTLDVAGVRTAIGLASANLDTQIAAVQADTDDIQARLPASLVSGRINASVGAMAADTLTASALASDAVTEIQAGLSTLAAGAAMTLTSGERNATADAILVRALAAESYAAPGAVPTLSQALHMLLSDLGQFSISGTTLTCKKLDGTTTSMTFTLDSPTAPTSRTRAT